MYGYWVPGISIIEISFILHYVLIMFYKYRRQSWAQLYFTLYIYVNLLFISVFQCKCMMLEFTILKGLAACIRGYIHLFWQACPWCGHPVVVAITFTLSCLHTHTYTVCPSRPRCCECWNLQSPDILKTCYCLGFVRVLGER